MANMTKSKIENLALRNSTVLLVEDNDDFRKLIVELLKTSVRQVYEAKDGIEGWNMFESLEPDIVILDIVMPKKDGVELGAQIRNKSKKTPIIYLSANPTKEVLLRAIKTMPNAFLIKPVKNSELLVAVANAAKDLVPKDKELYLMKCGAIVDFQKATITVNNRAERLSKKELKLLSILAQADGRLVPYKTIEKAVWGNENIMTEGSIKSLVYRIRKKSTKDCIEVMPGLGLK